MTRRIRALFVLSLLNASICVPSAYAIANEYDGNWFLAAGGGRSIYNVSDSDNYISACDGLPPDHYYKTEVHDGSFVDITGGYTWTRLDNMFPAFSVGLRYTYAFNGNIDGYVNQYDLSAFKNYSYRYDVSRQTLMAVFKANLFNGQGFMPYVLVGGGVSFNRASDYKESPTDNVTPRITPGYSTNTESQWAYALGAGVDYAVRDDIWIGLEYNYGYFGHVETGHGQATQTVSGANYSDSKLSNKLAANSIFVNFTYLINYV